MPALCGARPVLLGIGLLLLFASASANWEPNGVASSPSISYDGRYVVCASSASNMDFDDSNGFPDIFLWDRLAEKNSSDGGITRISLGAVGLPSRGVSEYAIISDDGSSIFFVAQSINLVPDSNLLSLTAQSRIFKHVISARTTSLESLFPNGTFPLEPVFVCGTSWDGRWLLFQTVSRGFIPAGVKRSNPSGSYTIYLKDTTTGDIQLVSYNRFNNATNNYNAQCGKTNYIFDGVVQRPLSADARFVAFESDSWNLDASQLTPRGVNDIYIRDMSLSQNYLITGARMIVEPGGLTRSFWDGSCIMPSLASNASMITFFCYRYFESVLTYDTIVCDFSNLAADPVPISCFVASVNSTGSMSNMQRTIERGPVLSANGRILVWSSNPTDMLDPEDPLYRTPGNVVWQAQRVFYRDLQTNQTKWFGRSKQADAPNSGGETRPALSGDGLHVVFTSNTPTLIEGQTIASIFQVFHQGIASENVTRPERPACPYPTEAECQKVSFQTTAAPMQVSLSGDGEIIAFSMPGAPLKTDVQEPPIGTPLPSNGETFMYLSSVLDELVIIVRDDSANPAPLGYVVGTIEGVSEDARYAVIRAASPPSSDHTNSSCIGALFLYDSFVRRHILITRDRNGACVPLATNDLVSLSGTGDFILFSTAQRDIAFVSPTTAQIPPNSLSRVFMYDRVQDVITLETTTAGLNAMTGVAEQQTFAGNCKSHVVSNNGRVIVFSCIGAFAGVYRRDVMAARSNASYVNERIDLLSTGELWSDKCSPTSISFDGSLIALDCLFSNDSLSVRPSAPTFSELEGSVMLLNISESLQAFSKRVRFIPPPWDRDIVKIFSGIIPTAESYQEVYGQRLFVGFSMNFAISSNFTVVSMIWHPDNNEFAFVAGHGNGPTYLAGVSEFGNYVGVVSAASNLVPYDVNGEYDAFLYSVPSNQYSLATTSTPYFSYVLPDFGCGGVRPHPRFICVNGQWVINVSYGKTYLLIRGNLNSNSGSTIVINGTVLVNGDINVGCNSTLRLGSGGSLSSSDYIKICGNVIVRPGEGPVISGQCAILQGGTIQVDLSGYNVSDPNFKLQIPVVGSGCQLTGTIGATTEASPSDPCNFLQADTVVAGRTISVLISVGRRTTDECALSTDSPVQPENSGNSLAIPLGASLGAIGFVLIVLVLLVALSPAVRYKIFPFLQHRESRETALEPIH